MSDFLFCITRPHAPKTIEIHTSINDPRLDNYDALMMRRDLGEHRLEWTLPVIDRALSEAALRKALRPYRVRQDKACFTCAPMEARGEAVKLTTLRADPRTGRGRKLSLWQRIKRAA